MNAGSGLGRGIALGFAKAGALGVVFADVNLDAATSVSAPWSLDHMRETWAEREAEHCLCMSSLLP